MRRKNYAADSPFVGPWSPDYITTYTPATGGSSTNTNPGGTDNKNNKGDFWKNLANIASGLFGGRNNQQQSYTPPQDTPKDKPNYGLIIGIIVAVIVVGVAIYFMTRK